MIGNKKSKQEPNSEPTAYDVKGEKIEMSSRRNGIAIMSSAADVASMKKTFLSCVLSAIVPPR